MQINIYHGDPLQYEARCVIPHKSLLCSHFPFDLLLIFQQFTFRNNNFPVAAIHSTEEISLKSQPPYK